MNGCAALTGVPERLMVPYLTESLMADQKKEGREQGGSIVHDPEAKAIGVIGKELANLPPGGRRRVLAWVSDKLAEIEQEKSPT